MAKKIVVAFDGSKYSNNAVREAVAMAKESGAKLIILSVVDITTEFETEAPGLADKMVEKTRKLLDKVTTRIAAQRINVEKQVRIGDPYEAIVDTAKKNKADLIVMGSHGRTGITRLLMGSVVSRVIGHAPCNVLIVRA